MHKGAFLLASILVLEFAYIGSLCLAVENAELSASRQTSCRRILAQAQELLTLFYGVQRCVRKMLLPENGRYNADETISAKRLAAAYNKCLKELETQVGQHPELLASGGTESPSQLRKELHDLSTWSDHCFSKTMPWLDELMAAPEAERRDLSQTVYRDIRGDSTVMEDNLVRFLQRQQETVLALPSPQSDLTQFMTAAIWLGLGANAVIAIGLALFFAFGITNKLSKMNANTVRLRSGQPLLPVLSGTDELAVLDKSFHEMAAQMSRNDELKRAYILLFKEDLRLPLTTVKEHLARLSESCESSGPVATRLLTSGIRSLSRLIVIVDDLTSIYERSSSSMTLRPAIVSPRELVDRAVEAVAQLASKHKCVVIIDDRLEPNQLIEVDGDRIVQVLINFLSNATKYSAEGTRINVRLSAQSAHVELAVQDQGRGIPPEQIDAVFERFRQVKVSDGKRGVGTGLGLSICKQIAELHGGTIGVESKLGAGSRFWLRVRLVSQDNTSEGMAT